MTIKNDVVLIVGSNTLQNELMASFLEKELSVRCVALDNCTEFKPEESKDKRHILILYDCLGRDPDDCMEECALLLKKNRNVQPLLCLFNLKKGAGGEEDLLADGIKGFFYQGERFPQFSKGVQAVLSGECWVSRKVMTDLITKNSRGADRVRQDILSPRESDILALVVEGATNEEIAVRLFISRHTVKTHLYNIFKKINVRSRFQAALWAAKHL